MAILLATIGAACNAYASVLQQAAVQTTIADDEDASRTISWRRLLRLARTPGWLFGIAMVVAGAAVHIVALILAPVSIVQPVGIAAVVFAIVLASRRRRSWPPARVWWGAAITVAGIIGFVVLASSTVIDNERIVAGEIQLAAFVLAALAAGFAVLGAKGPRWARCLCWAAACSVVFGLASAMLRALTLLIRGRTPWLSPVMITIVVGLVLCYAIGGWLAQQAYASGPPEIVMSCLTVVDPLVAVTYGLVVLREGERLGPPTALAMAATGVVAAAGVVLLARHHPEAHAVWHDDAEPGAPGQADVPINP